MSEYRIDGRAFRLRRMSGADRARVLDFSRSLPPHDLLFLRRDITNSQVVDAWLEAIKKGRVTTLLALEDQSDGGVLGYATLDRSGEPWTHHVAEIRVLVGEAARGMGLGKHLTRQIFRTALEEGVEKLVARMTLDQQGAVAVFENLGFRPEGLLKDHVLDRDGNKHDLLVMAHSVADFQATLDGFGVTDALQGSAV